MKNLNSFKAFELGKAQMNAITGGRTIRCDFGDQSFLYSYNGTLEEASAYLTDKHGTKVVCHEYN